MRTLKLTATKTRKKKTLKAKIIFQLKKGLETKEIAKKLKTSCKYVRRQKRALARQGV